MKIQQNLKHISVHSSAVSSPAKLKCIASSSCTSFFPANVLLKKEKIHFYFAVDGFCPLKESGMLSASRILQIFRETVKLAAEASDWMWYPDDYVLSLETIWMNHTGKLKIICIPVSQTRMKYSSFFCLADAMKYIADEEGKIILSELQHRYLSGSESCRFILSGIDQMLMEMQSYSPYALIK